MNNKPVKFGAKAVAVLLAILLIVGGAIGGTVAWLIAQSDTVINTFTYGDINISLAETTGETYEMMPGSTIAKDPTVTVKKGSEDCWLFVKLEKSANFDTFMEYEIADDWTALDETNHPGVYYTEIDAADVENAAQDFTVLKNDQVTVKGEVTKAQLNALDQDADGNELATKTYPTLTVTAYAVQRANIADVATAWSYVA